MKQAANKPQTTGGNAMAGYDPVNLDGFSIDPSDLHSLPKCMAGSRPMRT